MRHEHRRSIWVIAGGALLWCYRCGAWKPTTVLGSGRPRWFRPTGPAGKEPDIFGGRKRRAG